MLSPHDNRRSTSALLLDENEALIDAFVDRQPLLDFNDSDEHDRRQPCYRRLYARHGQQASRLTFGRVDKTLDACLVVASVVFTGFLCLYMLRVNLSVAIVAMTTPQSLKNRSIEACPSLTNDSSGTPVQVRFHPFGDPTASEISSSSTVNSIGILTHRDSC